MNGKLLKKLSLDFCLLALLVSAFSYPFTGNFVHELIGFSMLALAIVHIRWNRQWFLTLLSGRLNRVRLLSLSINLLLLLATLLLVVSGLMSSHILYSLFNAGSDLLPHELHSAAAYWVLILMAMHLGLHWKMVMAQAGHLFGGRASRWQTMVLRCMAIGIIVSGVHASFARELLAKLTAYYAFDFQGADESVLKLLLQYLAVIGLYASLTFYFLQWLLKRRGRCARLICRVKHAWESAVSGS